MTGQKLAKSIIETYKTTDVLLIAELDGVKIVYEKWYPITHGEFDKKTKTITVNLNSPLSKEEIIAHELGHYFADDIDNQLDREKHEEIARDFALYFSNIHSNPKAH